MQSIYLHDEAMENTWLILCLQPANDRRRYKVTPSLAGWRNLKSAL